MSKRKTFNEDQVFEISKRLKNKPLRIKSYSTRQVIERLSAEIRELLKKGYSWDEVVKILHDEGLEIKPTTLKSYLVSKPKDDSQSTLVVSQQVAQDISSDTKAQALDNVPPQKHKNTKSNTDKQTPDKSKQDSSKNGFSLNEDTDDL